MPSRPPACILAAVVTAATLTVLLPESASGQEPNPGPPLPGWILIDDMWLPPEAVFGEGHYKGTTWPNGNVPFLFDLNVNFAAAGGGVLALGASGFSLGLYDNLGRLLDFVRVTGDDDAVLHNHPRLPAWSFAFLGAAARQSLYGDGSFGRPRVATYVDSDRGLDWRGLFHRSMGFYDPSWVGPPGTSDALDVRLHETAAGDGLTMIINAGNLAAGLSHSYFFSLGHAGGHGPSFGLGPDALQNWLLVLATPPFSGVLDGQGSARVDFPPGSLPPGLQADCVFILQSASGALLRRTAIVEFDT